jgi:hypothetical protein
MPESQALQYFSDDPAHREVVMHPTTRALHITMSDPYHDRAGYKPIKPETSQWTNAFKSRALTSQ